MPFPLIFGALAAIGEAITFGAATGALATAVGAAAVATATAVVVSNWDKIVQWFREIWSEVKDWLAECSRANIRATVQTLVGQFLGPAGEILIRIATRLFKVDPKSKQTLVSGWQMRDVPKNEAKYEVRRALDNNGGRLELSQREAESMILY